MSKNDKEIFDSYASGNPNQRFDLIYKNYHTFPKLIDSFETGVFNMILNEREYNRMGILQRIKDDTVREMLLKQMEALYNLTLFRLKS